MKITLEIMDVEDEERLELMLRAQELKEAVKELLFLIEDSSEEEKEAAEKILTVLGIKHFFT